VHKKESMVFTSTSMECWELDHMDRHCYGMMDGMPKYVITETQTSAGDTHCNIFTVKGMVGMCQKGVHGFH
jgi:hypothetical protein